MYRGSVVLLIVLFEVLILSSCAKLVEVPSPTTELTSDNVYNTDATAAAVLTGIYTEIASNSPLLGETIDAISLVGGLSADELTLFGGAANNNSLLVQYYENALNSGQSASSGTTIWSDFYADIYIVNVALERLKASNTLSPAVKQQLIGEAEFMRAFFYFYLVNLYGDVPLTTTSNYTSNSVLARTSSKSVYQQIIADLSDAQNRLTTSYVASDATTSSSERVRPNKWAAIALLARVYLYSQNWDSAQVKASEVISNAALFQLDPINGVFLKNSTEAIWQLQPVNTGWNTEDGEVFILPATGPTSNEGYPVYMSTQILSAFESGDLRRSNWVDSVIVNGITYHYPYKYKSGSINAPVTEYSMMLRLGEQYLIRAEAEAEGAGTGASGSIADLNIIRGRAGLTNYAGASDLTSLLTAILHERQVELFTEWGHRWLDLKRSGLVDGIMTQVALAKGTTWNSDWQYYPLPLFDITEDPKLVQNTGY